jgi:hypothetical protein
MQSRRPPYGIHKCRLSPCTLQMTGTNWLGGSSAPKEEFLDLENLPPVSELSEQTRTLFEDVGIIKVCHSLQAGLHAMSSSRPEFL